MKEKETEKFLKEKLGKDVINALDDRYVINTEQRETNSIIAKKQKIADLYKSLDDEEKLLLGTIMDLPGINGSTLDFIMTFASKENKCKDFDELMDAKFKKIAQRIESKAFEGMESTILRDSPFHIW